MKKRIVFFASLFILSLLFTPGCKEDDVVNALSNLIFSAPSVGNRTNYRMISGPDTNSTYYEVLQKLPNDIYRVKQVTTWQFSPPETDTLYWKVTTNEWTEVSDAVGTKTGMRLFSDMELNKEYFHILLPNNRYGVMDTMSYKLTSKSESVTVPAGTFTCFKIVWKGTGSSHIPETSIFYSPGHGMVKYQNEWSRVEMTSHTP